MKPLDRGLNTAILHITSRLFPSGFDVSNDAPNTYEELRAVPGSGRRMVVYSGGSDATIYGDAEVNYAFRAWHDWGHIRHSLHFTLRDEAAVYEVQRRQLVELYGDSSQTRDWCAILRAEVVGQAEYFILYERFPDDQRAFIKKYLEDKRIALLNEY